MGFFGKIGKSAKQVAKQNVFEAIVAASVLVAAADGEVEPKEIEVLVEIGRRLGLNLKDYGIEVPA